MRVMLSLKEFTDKMKAEIRDYLPDVYKDAIIDDIEVVKMNDQKLHGLTIRMPESNAAPTLYVDGMYQAYRDGADIGYLAAEMANTYSQSMDAPKPPEINLRYEDIRDNLTVRLLEKKRNREFLSNMPYVDVGNGLAVIADVNMGETRGGDWRIAVNNSVLEQMGEDKETLFADAMKNSATVDPPTLVDMSSALFSPERINLLDRNEPVAPEDIGSIYVLTNASGSLGAAALFYPDVKEKTGEILGSDYYILPSSIHEVILVPDAAGIDKKELCDMVKQANRTVVEPQDILSDNVYHYSRDDRRLDKITAEPNRADMVAEGR
jgi:hypothetical protein